MWVINSLINKIEVYEQDKKISNISQLTQPTRQEHFTRRACQDSSRCPSVSQNQNPLIQEPKTSFNLMPGEKMKKIAKSHTVSMKLAKALEQQDQFASRRYVSGSMKMSISQQAQQFQESTQLQSQKTEQEDERQVLRTLRVQNKRLEGQIREERLRRQQIQEELMVSRATIRRLQKRLERVSTDKQRLKQQIHDMTEHILILESNHFGQTQQETNSFKVTSLEEEIRKLREVLRKKRSGRQKEMALEIEGLRESKYLLEREVSSLMISRDAYLKQFQDCLLQLQQLRQYQHQKVASSTQYIQLRQSYKIALAEIRWPRQQIQTLQKSKQRIGELTLLTISQDSMNVTSLQ